MENKNIFIDRDKTVGYEINTPVKELWNFFFIPVLNNIPRVFRNFIKKTNESAKNVIEKATTHEAIEVLYKNGEREKAKKIFEKIFYYIWFTTDNPKALRNRLRLVKREIKREILKRVGDVNPEITLLSIAAGSARGVLESVEELSGDIDLERMRLFFLDKNPVANDYSKLLYKQKEKIKDVKVEWITDTISNFPRYFLKQKRGIDIVEMVGLMDYFTNIQVEKVFSLIYESLDDSGVLIVGNIADNRERKFVTNVVGWNMIYKNPDDFIAIAERVGFRKHNIKVYFEPMKIHFVMIAQK